ncbi:hypothetical protein NPS01_03490 [Nocardioides psychrotolerans]|uniref:DUF3017 domain-containing protein n=1 Tax=Nocardioides psychrotolerans TaxID=1005945 RepID=A0A1I3BE62_9ACTN|nr:DUF3017 domain-containing protein [Nocardioides psychrotolerans]GEP36686.1 hypothetical protein NPS01_03490 [Nocardioides psychrotolerans]SFH60597.1 Protein of unknown function [Nocardioides psychrotolerans]
MTEGALPADRFPEEPVEEGVPEAEPAPVERRYPSTIGGACYLGVLITTSVGFAIVLGGNWRLGIRWLASALLAAATLRLVLPQRDAGMLAVRHRLVDVGLLAGVGGLLLFLVETIPDQPL